MPCSSVFKSTETALFFRVDPNKLYRFSDGLIQYEYLKSIKPKMSLHRAISLMETTQTMFNLHLRLFAEES
jgi:hypothetical protein